MLRMMQRFMMLRSSRGEEPRIMQMIMKRLRQG
jgi:hypothetical protein